MTIEEKLKAIRVQNGYTQIEIADLLGIERSTYTYYELGKIQVPLKHIQTLAAIYNINVFWFLDEGNEALVLHESSFGPNATPDTTPVTDSNTVQNGSLLSAYERVMLAKIRILNYRNKGDKLQEIIESLLQED